MRFPLSGWPRRAWWMLGAFLTALAASAQPTAPAPAGPMVYDADASALTLARKYLQGGDGARAAVLEALQRMGWSVRNAHGDVLQAPPAGTDTGLALRDYELEELLWKPGEQPSIRFISVAQALAVPFEGADPEELAQDLVDSIRAGAESTQPQRRFWARFIVALGRVSPANYDLTAPAPPAVISLSKAQLKKIEQEAKRNPFAGLQALKTTPIWPADDPVLAPSPRPATAPGQPGTGPIDRDRKRMKELTLTIGTLGHDLTSADANVRQAAQEKMAKLSAEMTALSQRQTAAAMEQANAGMRKFQEAMSGNAAGAAKVDTGPRFLAEWRDQPLSLLQVGLLTRVLAADVRQAAARGRNSAGQAAVPGPGARMALPFAMIQVAQVSGPAPSFGDQFSGAAGDIWATVTGAYTGAVLDHHLPENKFSKGAAIANTLIAWFKTIMSVARQNITIEVENAPLVRTKTRTAGEQRTARAKVEIDFPKSDVLKAIRAAGNLTSVDLQLPDGGPVEGAKVVWRLPEGSYNTKYQAAKGGWTYNPALAVVQFAQGGGYVSTTDSAGEATITLEGVPQRKQLSPNVRPYPRRATVAVEVTVKVGNLTQDLNDAISNALGGPIYGGLTFVADMVLRTSFFFQKGRAFEVTDWKEPAWEGEFDITVTAGGAKRRKGEKGGPPANYSWRMNRYMEGRLHTPEWEEETEQAKDYADDGRHKLEVDGDSRYFRLDDSSYWHSADVTNRYEASGPMQVQPPGPNRLEVFSRSEPSGSAELMFNGGFMTLDLKPFFGAECIVGRSEQGGGRSANRAGPEFLSLLAGVSPDTFTIIEPNDGTGEYVEGTKTFECLGELPYVPQFRATVVVNYRLWKNGPPPRNKPR